MDPKPSVGRIVHFFPQQSDSEVNFNAAVFVAAIVTKVIDETAGVIHLTAFPNNTALPLFRANVGHKSDPQTWHIGYWDWPPRI